MPQSVCVDKKMGIFLVRGSSKGEIGCLIRVRKLLHQEMLEGTIDLFCEDEL